MENRTFLRIIWIATGVILLATIIPFLVTFWTHPISSATDRWGQMGDYFGGILNPAISLISVVILTYISVSVSQIEERRNQFTLQELARPLGQIVCGDYEGSLRLKYKNCGLGPLIIKNIHLQKNGTEVSDSLIDLMPDPPETVSWADFAIDLRDFVIAKDAEINFLLLEGDPDDETFMGYQNSVRNVLKDLVLEVEYTDLYGRTMPRTTRSLELFGRRLLQFIIKSVDENQ